MLEPKGLVQLIAERAVTGIVITIVIAAIAVGGAMFAAYKLGQQEGKKRVEKSLNDL